MTGTTAGQTQVHELSEAVAQQGFLLNALLAGILAGIACGVVGTYVVARRISYIAGGIAHSVLGGMGAAYYLSQVHNFKGIQPMHGAVAAALLAAVIIGMVSLRAKQREDTVIGALWAVGMAVGLIFISRTPGHEEDLMGYLFGDILMVSSGNLWLMAGLDALVVVIGLMFYNQFLAVCFDEEFARVRGIKVEFYYLLLLCMTALTVVILATVVGIVMVIALMTIPAAVAGCFSRTMWRTMLLAALCSIIFTTAGLGMSYSTNLPAGATIIVLAGATYLVVTVAARLIKRA